MPLPHDVTLIEVGPRDGLQNEPTLLSSAQKIDFINQLSKTGLKNIEVTSFVSPHAVPQLMDAQRVYQAIDKPSGVRYSALIPNTQGMQDALEVNVQHIAIFTASSESFNQRNTHCSISESIERFKPVVQLAKIHHIPIRAYISCALGCPYEGHITPDIVCQVMRQLAALEIDEISFGDTIGVATPKQTQALADAILKEWPLEKTAFHFHDTYGQAIANIYAALEVGIHRFDSAIAGLGGCPYARGASGNVATEDVLYLLHGLGIETGIDIFKITQIGHDLCHLLHRHNHSKVAQALLR